MTQINLKYGNSKILFDLPEKTDIFNINEPEKIITQAEFLRRLKNVLKQLKPDFSNTAIVAADKTRICGYSEYLPILIKTLEDFGAETGNISIFIAYGTHPRQSDEESYSVYGNSYGKYRFIHHDCTDESLFINMGKTSRNTPIMIRRDIAEASFRITFGALSHHYFAGYGGGRKLIFPGLGFRNAIYHNHSLFLDKEAGTLAPLCQPGILDGNPLAEDLAEFENFCPAHMSIHGILNSRGEVCDLLPGAGKEHFLNACAEHGKNCEISGTREYDLVIASCGGCPKDINFIQSHKAVHNAAKFVRDGGSLIILAQCRDGIGSQTFLPWFKFDKRKAAFDRLLENYEGNGGTALSMMSKTERIKIYMLSKLDDKTADIMGISLVSQDQVRDMIKKFTGSLAVIPNASLLVKSPSFVSAQEGDFPAVNKKI